MTGWANTPRQFGRISRALHWAMALAILGQMALGLYLPRMAPGLANLWLFGLHKSIGFTLLVLALLRLAWHRISPPPAPLGAQNRWEQRLARTTHRALYALLILVPLTGWIGASGSGIETVLWNRLTLPAIAPATETWQDLGFALHRLATRALIALLLLHVAGALRRAARGDPTLRRMLTGGPP